MKKAVTPIPTVSDTDLRLALQDALTRIARPTSVTELRRALPKPYQRPPEDIARLLDELVRDRHLFSFKEGKTSRYALRDPREIATQAVLAGLRDGPLTKALLTGKIKRTAPGHDKLLPAVLAELLARGAVREHPKAGKQPARVGLEPPDPAPFLAKALKEIQAVQKKLAPHGVTAASVYAALGRALGLAQATGDGAANDANDAHAARDEAAVIAALRELASREPPNALLSVRTLRALGKLPKHRFDGAVLRLSRAGKVVLHHHDFPASLPDAERAELVEDGHGVHYVGIIPRRPS
ncbi:MAG TPA: hypothetical protein VLS89_13610 [Candidatus Nanopelagicales bacterium]|nr:hypothetical protein [Candidatus Nanopelagicales bacterium]